MQTESCPFKAEGDHRFGCGHSSLPKGGKQDARDARQEIKLVAQACQSGLPTQQHAIICPAWCLCPHVNGMI